MTFRKRKIPSFLETALRKRAPEAGVLQFYYLVFLVSFCHIHTVSLLVNTLLDVFLFVFSSPANQGLATLAFFGVSVNLVLFLTRVLGQDNASAANNVSKWTGTVYLCSLIGAFLSDSYWGRYLTCAVFQVILVVVIQQISILCISFLFVF